MFKEAMGEVQEEWCYGDAKEVKTNRAREFGHERWRLAHELFDEEMGRDRSGGLPGFSADLL